MPIYEYECCECEHRFERKQTFNDEPVSVCPQCQAKARRIISSVPIIFKGSGFYVTDNRKFNDKEPVTRKSEAKESVTGKGEAKEPVAGKSEAKEPVTGKSEAKEK